jgi:MFS family permease
MTVYASAMLSLALLRLGLWQFYLTCFVLGAVGNGAAHLAYSRSISTWFNRRLGTALAFVMVGAGLGATILPVVAQSAITRAGWRPAYAALGGIAFLLGCRSAGDTSRSAVIVGASPPRRRMRECRGNKVCNEVHSGLLPPSCS